MPAPSRIATLDIARGIAILGTLATNIWVFSHPGGFLGYLDHPTTPGAPAWQQCVERVAMALANGKFLGVLTLLFGVGLAIQAGSARRRGRPWPGGYPLRAAVLLGEGLVHFLLIAEFDVLMGYAVTGLLVCGLVLRPGRVRAWVAGGCVALHLVLVAGLSVLAAGGATGTGENPWARTYRDGTWFDLVALRVDNAALFRFEPVFIAPLSVAMFLAGAELWRRGVFEARGAKLRRRLMVAGAVAAPIDLALALTQEWSLFVCRYVLAPVVAGGLLALVAHVGLRGGPGSAGRSLALVGRMALTCYVTQNLVASALFYGWGLDLGGLVPALRLPVTVAAYAGVCALLVVGARWWLGRHDRGPVEALMARVTRR